MSEDHNFDWERDLGWHLPAFQPTVVDMFRLHMLRASHDLRPGGDDSSIIWRVPGVVLRRRTLGRALTFMDVELFPSRMAVVQIVADQKRWVSDTGKEWKVASICSDIGSVCAWVGTLGVSMTRVPSIYARKSETLRCAPTPDSVARLCAGFDSCVVTRSQATRALACSATSLIQLCNAVLRGSSSIRHKALSRMSRKLRGAPPKRNRRRAARVSDAEEQLLRDAESLPCFKKWSVPGDGSDEVGSNDDGLGRVEPSRNLPQGVGWERVQYAEQKKAPQVKWMLRRIRTMLDVAYDNCKVVHIVDVGGGRGDLALAIADAFKGRVFVTVIDTNTDSLLAGRARAEEERLSSSMKFVDADIEKVVQEHNGNGGVLPQCDLVVGLHSCGGLGEYAVALAVERGASFLVVTCCFTKNHWLAVLTLNAARPLSPLPLEAIKLLCGLAERPTDPPAIARRAAQVVNSARLAVVEQLFPQRHPTLTLQLSQAMFPARYSRANCVLVGLVLPKLSA